MGTPCAFCAETIDPDAAQCKHCGEHQGERDHSAASGGRGALIALAVVLGLCVLCLPAAGFFLFTGIQVAPPAPIIVGAAPLPTPTVTVSASPRPSNARGFGEHDYAFVSAEGITWEDAKAECLAVGGALAAIDSPKEQAFLVTLLKGDNKGSAWIGSDAPELLHATLGPETLSLNSNGYICEWPTQQ